MYRSSLEYHREIAKCSHQKSVEHMVNINDAGDKWKCYGVLWLSATSASLSEGSFSRWNDCSMETDFNFSLVATVFNTKGLVQEGAYPPPAGSMKLTIIFVLKWVKSTDLDSFLYQLGEKFLYCIYEWWLLSIRGQPASKGESVPSAPSPAPKKPR